MVAALTFFAMSVFGLPVWLLCRRFHVSELWQFALTGALVGVALATRVKLNAYRTADQFRWARGQETIRPALDAAVLFLYAFGSCVMFWAVTYRSRRVPS